ncbi:MFS transporter [Papiliotrema laurentii]|uniref:MFS transporter n=1 Tax=Papiliotrema laurentii TaxID=5418 RepID=A0AAD9FUG3_PAPLA|nr:MFS transporter [Papiliotrema laurentii]
MVRPTSLASLALTSGAPTPIDVTGSKAFLLPETLDFDGPTRPLAALERDLGVALHREEEVGDEAKATKGSEAEMTGVVATQPVGSSEGGGGGRPPSPLSVEEGGEGGPTSARGFLEGRGWGFKALFIATTCSAQLIAQGQFGMVVIPLYEVGRWLGTEEQGQLGWMAASYGLTVGMFLILSGRLGDMYGPKLLWLIGFGLVIIANLASGFCTSPVPFNVCRALGGIGAALSLPNAVSILGRTYPPGLMRSIVFAILGALAPIGFVVPGSFAALLADHGAVQWIWFTTTLVAAAFACAGMLVLPPDDPIPPKSVRKNFDYLGAVLLICSLGLFNFTWNQAPLVGWKVSYVWASLIVSVFLFTAFFLWEKKMGRAALIPPQVLSRTNLLVYTCLWLGWISMGTFLFYTVMFIRNIKETHTALGVAAQMAPCGPTGALAALIIPSLITRVPGHLIFLASMIAFLIGNVMMSVAPPHITYWAVQFPSLLIVIFGPGTLDMSFSTGQLIVSNSVPREFQGIAAGIVSMITNYSMSIGLGMAGTVEIYAAPHGPLLKGYRSAFYFASALAAIAVIVVGLFVRMPKMAHYRE